MAAVTSTSDVSAINEVSRLLFIYVGSGLFVFGTIGACANLCLFTTHRYRQIPCSLFIWMGALIDLIVLCNALFLYRILNTSLQYDPAASSMVLCKIRVYLIDALLPVPVWCVCFSTFDRFCITSRSANRRGWSTLKRARIMVATLLLICFTYRLPDLYYLSVIPTADRPICNFSPSVSVYTSIHSYLTFPVLLTTVPLALLIILSLLTRTNLRRFTAQQMGAQRERQVTVMVLLQAAGVSCIIPYTTYIFYLLATRTMTKSAYRMAVENLYYQIALLCFYAQYALTFYIYLLASSEVRRSIQVRWEMLRGRFNVANRITPTNVTPNNNGVGTTTS